MDIRSQIIGFADAFSQTPVQYWPAYVTEELKKEYCIDIVTSIVNESRKTASEAVFAFLSSIRYLSKDIHALEELGGHKRFYDFVHENYEAIHSISVKRKVQANIPERGFPLLEILARNFSGKDISLIELGSSYGLIGKLMVQPDVAFRNKELFFDDLQQYPNESQKITRYLGIDIDPPDKDWLVACYSIPSGAERMLSFIERCDSNQACVVIKGSAFGFSMIESVNQIAVKGNCPVVLTSFMLYQLDPNCKRDLKKEITEFCKKTNGHWINMDVDIGIENNDNRYFVELDGVKIMDLQDDRCQQWHWTEK